jgi:hypothetical protein
MPRGRAVSSGGGLLENDFAVTFLVTRSAGDGPWATSPFGTTRATQHAAVNDYGGQPRLHRRVTVAGDVPISIDGRYRVTRKKATPSQDPVASAS